MILKHRPTGLIAEANERRSQLENREQALFRLRLLMALEIRRPPPAEPSELWRSRLRGGKIQVSPTNADFPSLLAEALDQIVAHQYELRPASEALHCSATQLLGLIRDEPKAFVLLNAERSHGGRHPYR